MSSPFSSMNSNTSGTSQHSSSRPKVPMNKVVVGQAPGPNVRNVKSKIGSLNNIQHKPAGGEKKIESQKLTWNTSSRVGSLENANHKPQGSKVKVVTKKLEWNVKSKVGSLDNMKHQPGGGNVKIFDETKFPNNSSNSSTENILNNNFHHQNTSNYDQDQILRQLTQDKLKI